MQSPVSSAGAGTARNSSFHHDVGRGKAPPRRCGRASRVGNSQTDVYENVTGVTCLNVTFARLALVQPPVSGV